MIFGVAVEMRSNNLFPLETPRDRMYNMCNTVYYVIDIMTNMLMMSRGEIQGEKTRKVANHGEKAAGSFQFR